MRFTESATTAILETMRNRGLDPKEFVFDVSIRENGAVGIGFTKDRAGVASQYGDLTVMIGHNIDMEGVVVDFGEVDGRRGIIFLSEEEHVNFTDRTSGEGNQEGHGGTEHE